MPDGYTLYSNDTTDVANVKKDGYGGLSGVRFMQLSGRFILAAADGKEFEHFADTGAPVDSWYLLDTATGQSTAFNDIDTLRAVARGLDIDVSLKPVSAIYSKYQFTWFDWIVGFLLLVPPTVVVGVFVRYLYQTRRMLSG